MGENEDIKTECKHLNWIVRESDHIGWGYCPECRRNVDLATLINITIAEMRDVMRELRKMIEELKISK